MLKLQLIVLFSVLVSFTGIAQCASQASDVQCVEKITASNTFVKSYQLDAQRNGDTEFSTVLVKDVRYYLNLCEDGAVSNDIVINVYDNNRKLIVSNKTKEQSIESELSFTCDKTGVYYFIFKEGSAKGTCGLGALSFRR
jgi:hypothetical protein